MHKHHTLIHIPYHIAHTKGIHKHIQTHNTNMHTSHTYTDTVVYTHTHTEPLNEKPFSCEFLLPPTGTTVKEANERMKPP